MTGEGIGSSVVCTLEPLGSEIVTHDPRSQTLQPRVFDLVQAMRIKDRNKEVMVSNNREVAQSSEEEMALLDRPCNCQASSSITAYRLSASVRNLDPACTTLQSELSLVGFWRRRKPKPRVLASVWRLVSLEGSK